MRQELSPTRRRISTRPAPIDTNNTSIGTRRDSLPVAGSSTGTVVDVVSDATVVVVVSDATVVVVVSDATVVDVVSGATVVVVVSGATVVVVVSSATVVVVVDVSVGFCVQRA